MFGSFKKLVHSSSKSTLCTKLFVFFYHYPFNACGSVVTPPVFLDIGTCVSSFPLLNFQEGCCPHFKLPHIGLRGLIEFHNISSPHLSFLWPEKRDFFQSLSVLLCLVQLSIIRLSKGLSQEIWKEKREYKELTVVWGHSSSSDFLSSLLFTFQNSPKICFTYYVQSCHCHQWEIGKGTLTSI